MKPLSIYIHVPFCKSKCKYCHFTSDCNYSDVFSYIKALEIELVKKSKHCKNHCVNTVYIGGGTPTTLPDGAVLRLSEIIKNNFNVDIKEFTIEGNPESFLIIKQDEYIKSGINRVSLGVQSTFDDTLKAIGRIHDRDHALTTLERLSNDFSVNADMIVGLPKSTKDRALTTAKELLSTGISHLSCYSLQVEKGTKLYHEVKEGKVNLPSEDDAVEQYDAVCDYLTSHGFSRYEISNFAKEGKESLHNLSYWNCTEYLGIGASAHQYFNGRRTSNICDKEKYTQRVLLGQSTQSYHTKLTVNEQKEERIMLGLRLSRGIDVKRFNEDFNCDFHKEYETALNHGKNYLKITEDSISVLPQYFYVLNSIIQYFI